MALFQSKSTQQYSSATKLEGADDSNNTCCDVNVMEGGDGIPQLAAESYQ